MVLKNSVTGDDDTLDGSNLPAALQLAAQGFQVFPVWGVTPCGKCICGQESCKHVTGGTPGKHPAVRKWPKVATTDPAKILEWWTRHPHANIGIHAKGLLVIDVDGPEGHKSLQRLQRIGKLPKTATIRSGNTEPLHYQLLYSLPPFLGRIKNKPINKFIVCASLTNIDLKTTDGYIVGPGSRHHRGGFYTWEQEPLNQESLAKAPFWLVSLLSEPPSSSEPSSSKNAKRGKKMGSRGKPRRLKVQGRRRLADDKDIRHYAKQMINRFPVRRSGERNNQMTLAVASLVRRGLHPKDVSCIMTRWLCKFQRVFATSFGEARRELGDCIGRTMGNPRFRPVNHKSARDRISLPNAVHPTLSKHFRPNSLDWMFVEALLVMFQYKPTLTDDGDLKATNADWMRIIKTRHGKTLDNQQITRLKKKYVMSTDRGVASKQELMVELQKGGRSLGSGTGCPSVYRATGLWKLFPRLVSSSLLFCGGRCAGFLGQSDCLFMLGPRGGNSGPRGPS